MRWRAGLMPRLMNRVLVSLATADRSEDCIRFCKSADVKKELVVIISTDKGLCGRVEHEPLSRSGATSIRPRRASSCRDARRDNFSPAHSREMLADFELKDAPEFRRDESDREVLHGEISERRSRQGFRALHAFHQHDQPKPVVQNTAADFSSFDLPQAAKLRDS